jgi:two-component system invasion response regulator UvrY
MRIFLADDHALFRSGLRRILEEEFAGVTIDEASSGSETLNMLRQHRADILILDIAMSDTNSLHILPDLKALQPSMPVLILSMYNDRHFVVHALRAGVSGYLTKEHAPDELIRAIRTILAGRRYIGESLAEQIADHLAGGDASRLPHETLSARELEVLLLIGSGLALSQIAGKLGLSVKTVSTYRARILEKIGLHSNADLIRYVVRHGLGD